MATTRRWTERRVRRLASSSLDLDGEDADSLIQSALCAVLAGYEPWDPARYTLGRYVFQIMCVRLWRMTGPRGRVGAVPFDDPFVPSATTCPVDLSLVVAALQGDPRVRRNESATSYESIARFVDRSFEDEDERERLYAATVASAAFPGLYAPVTVPGLGECLDGGAVNNTPIAQALAGRSDIGRVIVVAHTPTLHEPPAGKAGAELAGHVGEILVTERLYRDLREARRVNDRLAKLDKLVDDGILSNASESAVRRALGLLGKRPIEVIEIRPATALRGGAFPGLSSRAIRDEYIDAGRVAALAALPQLA